MQIFQSHLLMIALRCESHLAVIVVVFVTPDTVHSKFLMPAFATITNLEPVGAAIAQWISSTQSMLL